MKIESCYPVIMTDRVAETAAFWQTHLGFDVVFQADWYVHLSHSTDPGVNIAVLDHSHQTVPAGYGRPVGGVLVNIEVEDVDAEWSRLQALPDVVILLPIRDEAFGQRHFILRDPAGTLIDMIKVIPHAAEYDAAYGAGVC
ncbi:VOC family protein [Tistrella sp. BH-R2-4]|uniref:VOC family protein n=1 Tax=Tistrella arctica TaxID=3133430 RepID=A0ABU9YD27_9PROT